MTVPRPGRWRRQAYLSTPLLAGWLFADLFIVLFIVSLASFIPPAAVTPGPGPARSQANPAHSPAKLSPARSTGAAPPVGISQRSYTVCLSEQAGMDADDATMMSELDAQLPSSKLRVGFVLVYSPGANTDLGAASQDAQNMLDYLLGNDPVFSRAAGDSGGHGNPEWEFRLFFFTSSPGPTGGGSCSS